MSGYTTDRTPYDNLEHFESEPENDQPSLTEIVRAVLRRADLLARVDYDICGIGDEIVVTPRAEYRQIAAQVLADVGGWIELVVGVVMLMHVEVVGSGLRVSWDEAPSDWPSAVAAE